MAAREHPFAGKAVIVTGGGSGIDAALRQRPVPADRFARAALRGVARNRAVIVAPRSSAVTWHLLRLSPSLTGRLMRGMARSVVADLIRPAEGAPPASTGR